MSGAVLTVEQMRAAEKAAMDDGVSAWELMQRAGEGAAQWVARIAGGRSVTVLCGPGNNGGDGYVIAESLRRRGLPVSVVAPRDPATDTARTARENFEGSVSQDGLPVADVYVDCLFGYGLSRPVEGAYASLLAELSRVSGYKIAIDVPSGVVSDTGEYLGPALDYDLTLALGAWKRAHFTMPAMSRMGIKRLLPIGLDMPSDVPKLSGSPRLSAPAADAHKYRRGLLAIVAGAMPGAPLLAADAAMRSGAGYVKLLSEHSHPDAPAELVIAEGGLDNQLEDDRISALLIGPGLGREQDATDRLGRVLAARKPTVLDADALVCLTQKQIDGIDPSKLVLTPHEGELGKLCETFGIEGDDKQSQATALHRRTGMTVLAKGPDTVLASGEGIRLFPRGSSWLSAAGTGDVLAGILASRLAVHGEPARAAEEAVWLHQEAARLSGPAFTAGELAGSIGRAMAAFL